MWVKDGPSNGASWRPPSPFRLRHFCAVFAPALCCYHFMPIFFVFVLFLFFSNDYLLVSGTVVWERNRWSVGYLLGIGTRRGNDVIGRFSFSFFLSFFIFFFSLLFVCVCVCVCGWVCVCYETTCWFDGRKAGRRERKWSESRKWKRGNHPTAPPPGRKYSARNGALARKFGPECSHLFIYFLMGSILIRHKLIDWWM